MKVGQVVKNIWENKYVRGLLYFLILWEVLAILIHHPALPGPGRVLALLGKQWQALIVHFLRSGYRVSVGMFLALGVGLPAGIALGYWQRWDRVFSPLVYIVYPIPKIAFLPLVLLVFGLGDFAKIFIIAMILVFQIIVVTRDGVKELPEEYFYSIRSLGAGEWEILQHVVLPAILPRLITVLRLSIGTAIAVLFFAETFATYQGLGYYIMDSWTMLDYERMFLGIFGLSLLGLAFFWLIDLAEKVFIKWR